MSGRIHLGRKPVGTLRIDTSILNIPTDSWQEITPALERPACYVQIMNSTGQALRLAKGALSSEVEEPYTVLPSNDPEVIAMEFSRNDRLSLRAIDDAADAGYIIFNFFG